MTPRHNRARDWLEQAQRDVDHARHAMEQGFHEWACFSAQQAAEKALKAVYIHLGRIAWGHSVKRLLEGLQDVYSVDENLMNCARLLDRFYLPTRYPNGFDYGKPGDYYTQEDSQKAIGCAMEILRFGAGCLAGPGTGSGGSAGGGPEADCP